MAGPFYKMRRDALEDAGITSRQEQHWSQHGLFLPELYNPDQKRNGRYTKTDIERLEFLGQLIDTSAGLGIPVAIVAKLISGPDFTLMKRPAIDINAMRIIDLDNENDD